MSATLTPWRLTLLAVLIVAAGLTYLQFRSFWVEVDERTFDRRVLQAPQPAIVYFDTAIGCRGGDGVFRKLSRQWRGALNVFYVNSIDNPRLAQRYGVGQDVVFVMFERGREVKRATAPQVHAAVAAKNNGFYSRDIFLREIEVLANVRR